MAFGTYGTDQISGILPMRREMIFSRQINVICPVQSPLAKIFRLRRRANQKYNSRRLIPHEGRWPSSRTLGWDAVDAAASGAERDRRADRKICERSTTAQDERCCSRLCWGFRRALSAEAFGDG